MCSTTCDSTSSYVLRLKNVNNPLKQTALSGSLTVRTQTSAALEIGTGIQAYSSVGSLTVGGLTSPSVVRNDESQGVTTDFTVSFMTPGILLD